MVMKRGRCGHYEQPAAIIRAKRETKEQAPEVVTLIYDVGMPMKELASADFRPTFNSIDELSCRTVP
jgi:hypothetical protein